MWATASPNLSQPSNRRSFRAKSPTGSKPTLNFSPTGDSHTICAQSINQTVESRNSLTNGGAMANSTKNTSSSRTGSIKSFSEGEGESFSSYYLNIWN